MENLTAYHVYYQNKDFGEYFEIDLLVQLASALFWKKNYGPIKLYCNKKFLETLKQYDLDKVYDEVNTTLMESIPYKEYLPKYWSFCKIYLAKYLNQREDRFVILDTDLWIREDIGLDFTLDLINYHEEIYKEKQTPLTYVSPKNFVSKSKFKEYNWNILPANGAFIYLNNKPLINKWYTEVIDIIESNKSKPKLEYNADTVFIEQRLLPVIADSMGLKRDMVFPSKYKTWVTDVGDLSEWEPILNSTERGAYLMDHCKHIWGVKNSYRYKEYRDLVLNIVIEHLEGSFNIEQLEDQYPDLFNTCYNIWDSNGNIED